MQVTLWSRLALDSADAAGLSVAYSVPLPVEAANTIQVDAVVYALTATSVAFQVQEGNGIDNWADVGGAQGLTTVGYKLFDSLSGLSASHLRLKVTANGGKAVVAVGANLSSQ